MGIHKFSDSFKYTRPVNIMDMTGQTIAIDAFWKIYQANLGMEKIDALTDKDGNPTAYIQILLSNIIQMHRSGVKQIWVFDFQEDKPTEKHHNPAKQGEIDKRRQRKDVNHTKIQNLTLELFNRPKKLDFDEELDGMDTTETKIQNEIDNLKKRTFHITRDQVDNLKKILFLLGIPYLEGISGYEGEHLASYLVQQDIADAVFSGDSDPIAFGAKRLYRKVKKDIFEYTLEDILRQIKEKSNTANPDLADFRKIAVILGGDFCAKTAGVGPRTVFQKYQSINLTTSQKECLDEFSKLDNAKLNLDIINKEAVPFEQKQINKLIDWLVDEKGFNRSRLVETLTKAATPIKSKSGNLFENKTKTKKIEEVAELVTLDTETKTPTKRRSAGSKATGTKTAAKTTKTQKKTTQKIVNLDGEEITLTNKS